MRNGDGKSDFNRRNVWGTNKIGNERRLLLQNFPALFMNLAKLLNNYTFEGMIPSDWRENGEYYVLL